MGTLYIDRKGIHVKLDGNALAFYADGERAGMAPINPLTRVVVIGNACMETPVLQRLAEEGVSVIFLSGRQSRFCGRLSGRLHNNGLLRVAQYQKSLDAAFAADVAVDIVRRKVAGQAALLGDAREKRPDIRTGLSQGLFTLEKVLESLSVPGVSTDSARGLEGGAAAAYFAAYTTLFPESLGFKNRNRRPPEDPVNAVLSLCYTMLHFEVVREVEITGLDPVIGFLHQFDYGRESLACDLVEPYRPEVDRFVWGIFRERVFTARDFPLGDERPGCYLKKESRKRFYPLYEEWAAIVRPRLTAEVRQLARRIMDGQDPVSD